MAKLYDVVVTVSKYKDKDGSTKYINENIGSVLDINGNKKLVLKSHINLAALQKDDQGKVWATLFEPRDNSQTKHQDGAKLSDDQPPF